MKKTEYTVIYRIVHWAMALTFILLLGTIYLRMTWFNKNSVAEIILNYLSTLDVELTEEQAVKLAKRIRRPMWIWHVYIGYVLTGIVVLRCLLPAFGIMKFQSPFDKNLTPKDKFKNWTYILFYIFTIITLITGLVIVLGPRDLKNTMEAIHKPSIYYIVAFLIIHFGGILIAEFTNDKGIISRIISGKNK